MFSQAENLWQKRSFCPSIRTNGWKLAYIAICPWTRNKIFVCPGVKQENMYQIWKLRSLIADWNDFVLTHYPIVKETRMCDIKKEGICTLTKI